MSRTGDLKSELINRAYEELRISGITKQPTPRDTAKALDTLENMMEEFSDKNICVNYNFEDEPDLNSLHNVKRKYWDPISLCIARRLLSTFGKGFQPDPQLLAQAAVAFSSLSASTAIVRQVQPSSRMPVGSGSRRYSNRYSNFNHITEQAPISCNTKVLSIGAINDFVEHFDAYLNAGETISSYTIEAGTGLIIVSDSNATPDINYRISATTDTGGVFEVAITVTTSDARVEPRLIIFNVSEVSSA